MKYMFGALIAVALMTGGAHAHMSGMMTGDVRYDTMRLIEDEALGSDELHERMETLMDRMMEGEELSDAEIEEMVSYMHDYPGVHSMMMGRYVGGTSWGAPMHAWGSGTYGWDWFGKVTAVVWLLVGILALIWLARKVFNI